MTCYAPNLQWEPGKESFRPHPTPKLFFLFIVLLIIIFS